MIACACYYISFGLSNFALDMFDNISYGTMQHDTNP